jgi:RHS repeat-associated protein
VGNYAYSDPANPYKLTSIDNRPPTINGDNQHITYNSFNKVTQITEEDPATSGILRQLDLVYGTGNQRVFQQMQTGQNVTIKYYAGGDYEVENKDGVITRVHYIYTPSGLAAIVKRDEQNNDDLNFVLNDHLGSMQVLANAAGQLLEEFSYDPWGLRRDPVTLAVYAWAAMPVTGMDYGFTGHEHLDIFMLVNMNGRMYDPTIGRFITPDPVLQFPNYTQGLNPYSYALNNPLRFVDPDGYSLIGNLIALSVQIAFTAVQLPMLGVLAYSVIMTVDYAIEHGRNVKAGDLYGYFMQTFVMSGISMQATNGIGGYFDQLKKTGLRELGRALAHGAFNGAMRFAQGGKFEHGFMSGFVSSLGGSFMQTNIGKMSTGAQVVMSAVIGGTAEKLGGGKFANGAVTGAYVMMFNHLMEQGDKAPSRKWMEKKAKEIIEFAKAQHEKAVNGESTYGDNLDLNFEEYTNITFLEKVDSHRLSVSIELDGQKYVFDFSYRPASNPEANRMTSLEYSGAISYYGVAPGDRGKMFMTIMNVRGGNKMWEIGHFFMDPRTYSIVINYIEN